MASTHSGRLPTRVITTFPRRTPRARSAPAARAVASATSPKRHSRRAPSRPSATSARWSGGAASTTSELKFTRGRLRRRGPDGAARSPAGGYGGAAGRCGAFTPGGYGGAAGRG
jgi:hypothetical protein